MTIDFDLKIVWIQLRKSAGRKSGLLKGWPIGVSSLPLNIISFQRGNPTDFPLFLQKRVFPKNNSLSVTHDKIKRG